MKLNNYNVINFISEHHNVSKSEKCDENTISSPPDKVKSKISLSPIEAIKIKHNIVINKDNTSVKPLQKNHPTIFINPGFVSKLSINNDNETLEGKRKRPRISMNSDNEDDKTGISKAKFPITSKETIKQIAKELPIKINKKTMSQVVVVKTHCKVSFTMYICYNILLIINYLKLIFFYLFCFLYVE